MPLIECPDCTGKVSDKAPACPHCGCPASALKANLKQQVQTSGTAKYPPSDSVADALKENLKQPKSSSRENEKHLEDDRDWLFSRKARINIARLAAVCCLLFPYEESTGQVFLAIIDDIYLPTFCFESLAVFLIAFSAYKNTYALKSFILKYLSAAVLLFPPALARGGVFAGYYFLGNNGRIHYVIWLLEIFLVGIGFYLLNKQKNR